MGTPHLSDGVNVPVQILSAHAAACQQLCKCASQRRSSVCTLEPLAVVWGRLRSGRGGKLSHAKSRMPRDGYDRQRPCAAGCPAGMAASVRAAHGSHPAPFQQRENDSRHVCNLICSVVPYYPKILNPPCTRGPALLHTQGVPTGSCQRPARSTGGMSCRCAQN